VNNRTSPSGRRSELHGSGPTIVRTLRSLSDTFSSIFRRDTVLMKVENFRRCIIRPHPKSGAFSSEPFTDSRGRSPLQLPTLASRARPLSWISLARSVFFHPSARFRLVWLGEVVNRSNQIRGSAFVSRPVRNADFPGQPPGRVITVSSHCTTIFFLSITCRTPEPSISVQLWKTLGHAFCRTPFLVSSGDSSKEPIDRN